MILPTTPEMAVKKENDFFESAGLVINESKSKYTLHYDGRAIARR